MSSQVAQDLRDAASALRRDGWAQGTFVDDGGCRCAAGAILAVVEPAARDPYTLTDSAYYRYGNAWGALAEHLDVTSVSAWNDADERTEDEVLHALEAAAEKADQ